MVLAPWNDPLPLQRGWCIWELSCTIEGKRLDENCKFDVAMSSGIEQFIADVDADPVNVINKMLATIDTSKSKCYKGEDKKRIHEAIRRTVGFNKLNKEIFEIMRGWVISKSESRYKDLAIQLDEKTLYSMNNLAMLYSNQGKNVKALSLCDECLKHQKVVLGESNPETLNSMSNLAALYSNQGEYVKALRLYEDCLKQRKVV